MPSMTRTHESGTVRKDRRRRSTLLAKACRRDVHERATGLQASRAGYANQPPCSWPQAACAGASPRRARRLGRKFSQVQNRLTAGFWSTLACTLLSETTATWEICDWLFAHYEKGREVASFGLSKGTVRFSDHFERAKGNSLRRKAFNGMVLL